MSAYSTDRTEGLATAELIAAEIDAQAGTEAEAERRGALASPVVTDPRHRGKRRTRELLLLLGMVLAALNMRAPLAAVSPVLGEIGTHFGLAATASSLVTTIPLLTMGLASPLAPRLARRWGTEAVLCGALVLLAAGVGLRAAPPVVALFGGCAVVGTAIAMLNVLMPGLIKRDFPQRAAAMTALYSTAMILGATVSAAVAVPLERLLGGWQGSLASWAVLAALAALVWLPQALSRRAAGTPVGSTPGGRTADGGPEPVSPPAPARRGGRGMARSPLAWQVTLFMGAQSLIAYVTIAWMPLILTDAGMPRPTAGLVFAFSTLVQMAGSFVVPTLAGRARDQRLLAVAVVALMAGGIAGLLVAPAAGAWLWAALLGVGQGGTLGLSLTLMVLRTRDAHSAATLSGMAQTWGYLLAAVGPLTIGAVRQLTGGWTVPIVLLLAVCAGLVLLGLGAGRDRTVSTPA